MRMPGANPGACYRLRDQAVFLCPNIQKGSEKRMMTEKMKQAFPGEEFPEDGDHYPLSEKSPCGNA